MYSGNVAGYTFKAIRNTGATAARPQTVVVLGLSHRQFFKGVALMDGDRLATPLGTIPLDTESGAFLVGHAERIHFDYAPHAGEHSAENQIPFLQAALPGVPTVVGIIGDHDPNTIDALVDALDALASNRRILVVASTDLLHDPDYERVNRTDRQTLERITALDINGVMQRWTPREQVCCGIGPVVTAMRFARRQGCERGTLLHYRNSGDDFPESRGNYVVGYGAVAFTVPE
jgi:AmmeMemoRadiSam system protein B